jgi:hypothetical protein
MFGFCDKVWGELGPPVPPPELTGGGGCERDDEEEEKEEENCDKSEKFEGKFMGARSMGMFALIYK